MRIGITGVSGFIGRELAKACVEAGHEVAGFSRNPDRELENVAEVRGISPHFDLSDLDAVVNLAGEPLFGLWTKGKKRQLWNSRIGLTGRIILALRKMPANDRPKVLVSGSGVGIYGDRGDDILAESEPVGGGQIAHLAEGWEERASEAAELGVRVVLARISMALGPGGGPAKVLGRVFKLCLGGKFGNGKQWVSWIAVDDLAQQLLAAVENEAIAGPVNCVSPNPVTNYEMTKTLGRILKRPTIFAVPAFAPKLFLPGMNEMLLFSQRSEPAVWRKHGFDWKHETIESALKAAFKK